MKNTSELRQLLVIALAAAIGAVVGDKSKPYFKKGLRSRR